MKSCYSLDPSSSTETHTAGETLFATGDRPVDFFIVVSGRAEIFERILSENPDAVDTMTHEVGQELVDG